jgi:hypothetical protein
MKASSLICSLKELIHKHGDLDTIVDCDSFPTEIDLVGILTEPYSQTPVFLISLMQSDLTGANGDSRTVENC